MDFIFKTKYFHGHERYENLKLGLCRGKLGLSFHDKIILVKHAKILAEGKNLIKKRHFFTKSRKWRGGLRVIGL